MCNIFFPFVQKLTSWEKKSKCIIKFTYSKKKRKKKKEKTLCVCVHLCFPLPGKYSQVRVQGVILLAKHFPRRSSHLYADLTLISETETRPASGQVTLPRPQTRHYRTLGSRTSITSALVLPHTPLPSPLTQPEPTHLLLPQLFQ